MTNSKKRVFIIGHRNPDSDSICSAIAYAYFKNITDKKYLYIPARTGPLNAETQFILKYFGLEIPFLIKNVIPRVNDIDLKPPIYIYPEEPIYHAVQIMRKKEIRILPVVDEYQNILGIIGQMDIAQYYVEKITWDILTIPIQIKTLVFTLKGRILANPYKKEELKGRIFIAAMQKGTTLHYVQPGDIAILGDRTDIQLELIKAGCEVLILSEEPIISEEVLELAKEKGTIIISSPFSIYTIAQILPLSLPVKAIMKKAEVVHLDTPISDVKKRVLASRYRSVLVADSEGRLIGVITRSDLISPIQKKVILVDHNDSAQAVLGIKEAEILEIIDHHHLGDISTFKPIYVYNDPVGSTCTIITELMQLHRVEIVPEIAGALLGGILSDTLILTLSTTTERDKRAALFLAKKAGVNIEEFGRELIKAQAEIKGKTAKEILFSDFKEYHVGDKKIGVGQILVLDRKEIEPLTKEIKLEMEKVLNEQNFNLVTFIITCPFDQKGEQIFVKGEEEIIEMAFDIKIENDACFIPQVMSRKRDFIPQLAQAMTKYEF